jgi:hypothetical protein
MRATDGVLPARSGPSKRSPFKHADDAMKSNRFLRLWIFGNLVWLLAVPLFFGLWLSREIDAQYVSGVRTSGNGDSVAIPIVGAALVNGVGLMFLNAAVGLFFLVRRPPNCANGDRTQVGG